MRRGITLDWENLTVNKCPACGYELKQAPLKKEILICPSNNCTFYIYQKTFDEIIENTTPEKLKVYIMRRKGLARANPHYAKAMAAIRARNEIDKDIANEIFI